jgi:hypothetical protein
MSEKTQDEFIKYLIDLGKNINIIYKKMEKLEIKIEKIKDEMTDFKDSTIKLKSFEFPTISEEIKPKNDHIKYNSYQKLDVNENSNKSNVSKWIELTQELKERRTRNKKYLEEEK